MANRDPRVDAYIANSAQFAQPILRRLREIVHGACPEVEESIKWGCPHFVYRGAILCSMAAFRQHCAFGFRLHDQIVEKSGEPGMGQFGKIASVRDLPAKRTLAAYIRKAMALNEAGVKRGRAKTPKPAPVTPADLAARLARNAAARRTWDGFTDAMRREYVGWIEEARTDPTRQKRLATTLEWLAQGKQRNWKYMS
ncbi:MAG TPA: YdeI/OmpD-associated family protein [Rhodanobacteraceae bacterium]|nr:YdeI/OmpD-associated family protein [Rhodanobacteraceae bacterium]